MFPVKWTRAEEKQIKDLWLKGWTSGRIAAKVGKNRNQIMGKLHRMGLMGKVKIKGPPIALQNQYKELTKEPTKEQRRKMMDRFASVNLVKANPKQCHEIIGEPKNGMICGKPVKFERSYCTEHCIKNYAISK